MSGAPFFPRSAIWIGLLALGCVLSMPFAAAAETGGAASEPDYSGYQSLLDAHVKVVSPEGGPIETVFDYTGLYRDPSHLKSFAAIREQLFGVSPGSLDDRARLAWAINAYNYLVIETVTKNLHEGTQKLNKGGKRYFFALHIATVNTIDLDGSPFFEGPLVEIEGQSYSLNTFERKFVFRGFEPKGNAKPPAGLDPRAHFALVCASKGCPPLMPRAYRDDSLDKQLDFAVRNALASPRHLRFNSETKRLEASSIFDWYFADFGGREAAFAFLKKYAPPATRADIERQNVPWISSYILWDWKLNHPESGNEKPWEAEEKHREEVRSGH
jgi:hypothetical protein